MKGVVNFRSDKIRLKKSGLKLLHAAQEYT
jgi:hypothetical protein